MEQVSEPPSRHPPGILKDRKAPSFWWLMGNKGGRKQGLQPFLGESPFQKVPVPWFCGLGRSHQNQNGRYPLPLQRLWLAPLLSESLSLDHRHGDLIRSQLQQTDSG